MILRAGVLIAGLLSSMGATASLCPAPARGAGVEWDRTCFEADHDGRRVKPAYLKRLRFDRRGYTTVMISEPRELVAIDRRGRIVVPGIMHTGDFDFPTANGGVGRFIIGSHVPGAKSRPQCGYFDSSSFRIIVPAEYDHCAAFADGEAIACKDCESKCWEPDCQDRAFFGGEGFALAPDGKIRRRFRLPEARLSCTRTSGDQGGAARQTTAASGCKTDMQNSFNQLN